MFTESFCEATQLSALCIPKSVLHERGLRHSFPTYLHPDPALADVDAIRRFVLYVASLAGKASQAVLSRLGDLCVDLIGMLVDGCNEPSGRPLGAAAVLLAKQLIARRIGDPDLSAYRIATELNMSTSSLNHILQAEGLSVMRYAWSLRLERAAQRLVVDASHGTIKRIAFQCGFKNHAHFSRVFKARYGMTPP
jgi:AraC-like DNA-binding protein